MTSENDPPCHSPASASAEQLANSAILKMVQGALTTTGDSPREFVSNQARLAEHRRSSRKKFSKVQLIAPYDGHHMPAQAAFQPQLCHDLSPMGFSYWLQEPVAATQLIIALGEVPFLFFVAEIVHQAYEPLGEPGGWRIGCRFLRRLER